MRVVDFHSHILPGIDDGSKSVEESLELLRMEKAQGIGCVVATPHFYPNYDSPGDFLARRNRSEKQLREAIAKEDGLPKVIVGAEVYFFRGMSQSELIPELTIGESKCILIEMPPAPWSEEIYRELENIWEKWGITPIVAHIDRYIRPFRTYGIPKRLSRLPVLVQANAEFFLEKATTGMALRMLKKDQIQLLGSDCHNLTSRKPNLGAALEKIRQKLGDGMVEEISVLASEILGV